MISFEMSSIAHPTAMSLFISTYLFNGLTRVKSLLMILNDLKLGLAMRRLACLGFVVSQSNVLMMSGIFKSLTKHLGKSK